MAPNTSLTLAVNCELFGFVSHRSVHNLLKDVWTGAMKHSDLHPLQCIAGIFWPPYILHFDFFTESQLKTMISSQNDTPDGSKNDTHYDSDDDDLHHDNTINIDLQETFFSESRSHQDKDFEVKEVRPLKR